MKRAAVFSVPLVATLTCLVHCGTSSPPPAPTAAAPPAPAAAASAQASPDDAFRALERRYAIEFFRRNPTVSTYLGASVLDPSLADVDGRLRDHGKAALAAEDQWLAAQEKEFEAATGLQSPALRIDRDLALGQIRFLLHQHGVRRYQERAIDSYVDEPFRAVDFSMQGMTKTGPNTLGTTAEWRLLASRMRDTVRYLETAQAQLEAGIAGGNTPDARLIARQSLPASESNAVYFEEKLPPIAAAQVTGPERDQVLGEVREASHAAAGAYRNFHRFIAATYFDDPSKGEKGIKARFAGDRFAMGESEYDWALKNNLRIDQSAAELYERSWPIVQATREKIVKLAREIGQKRKLALPKDDDAAVRAVLAALSHERPETNEAMFADYRTACFRLVDSARKAGLFDVPADYRLDIMETPEPLRPSISAAYYPAPAFKESGVGRVYISPEKGKPTTNVHAMANLCAHEAFPGHDWHYQTVAKYKKDISLVRWLLPGAVEDSSSMWTDSMASEGWGLYAESLVAEPTPGNPHGLFTAEEHLYQLFASQYRELRVRVDTGMHIGRLSFDDVVDLLSSVPNFLPGSCRDPKASPEKRESCRHAEQGALRYARTPTQAVTYRLGRDLIQSMRAEAEKDGIPLKRFHLAYMQQGLIPPTYFRDELLRELRAQR